jgi:hypothetical protein
MTILNFAIATPQAKRRRETMKNLEAGQREELRTGEHELAVLTFVTQAP